MALTLNPVQVDSFQTEQMYLLILWNKHPFKLMWQALGNTLILHIYKLFIFDQILFFFMFGYYCSGLGECERAVFCISCIKMIRGMGHLAAFYFTFGKMLRGRQQKPKQTYFGSRHTFHCICTSFSRSLVFMFWQVLLHLLLATAI